MRIWLATLCASAVLLLGAESASAYAFSIVRTSPEYGEIPFGELAFFDVVLDIPVNEGLSRFSVAVLFDPTIIAFRPDLSVANDYYPLYTPSIGKQPAKWLSPNVGNPLDPYAPSAPGFFSWPAPPPGLAQVNVEFLTVQPPLSPTYGTATGLVMGTIAFEGVGLGGTNVDLSLSVGGTIFEVDGTDLRAAVDLSGGHSFVVVNVPEPATALLVGLGLAALGVRRRTA